MIGSQRSACLPCKKKRCLCKSSGWNLEKLCRLGTRRDVCLVRLSNFSDVTWHQPYRLGSPYRGRPIYFRGFRVGQILWLIYRDQWIGSNKIKRRYPNTTTISQGICWWKGDTMMNNNTNTTFCVSQGKTVCLFFLSQIWSEGYTWLSCIPGWSELKVWPHQYIYRLYTGWVRCHKSWLPPHRFNRYLNCTRALKQLFVVPPTQCQKWVKPFLAD